ncbi:MAG: MBL fold metallo-hydrolase [Saprospiraceae bacterium]|nr:MBL fold metallo-hydrolase [Saprospiraceae bacterium]
MNSSRRTFIKKSSFAATAALLPWQKLFSQTFNNLDAEMYLIRDKVGVYKNRGGTIGWLIDQEGLAVVDTQFPDAAKDLIQRIQEKQQRPIDLLINTHHHGDHSSGNIAFKGIAKKVVAHENSKANQQRVAEERGKEAEQLYPDTTFSESWSQKLGSEVVTINYFGAAHTNGDSVIHFENANVAHLGDLLFNRRFPYIDRSAGANIENWIEVLGKIRKTYDKDTIFICGHAGEGHDITVTRKDLKAKQKFLKALLKYTKKGIKQGKTIAELSKAEVIPGAEEWQGRGMERVITAAYGELTENK